MDSAIDLRPFLRAMGGSPTRGSLDVPEREAPEHQVELLDDEPAHITEAPLNNPVFIDGIQSSSVLAYRAHRPVAIVMAAAGAVDGEMNPQHAVESLEVLCAREDQQWVLDMGCPVPVNVVSESFNPVEVERAVAESLKTSRDDIEVLATHEVLNMVANDRPVLVDGHLAGRPEDPRLGGIVKSTDSQILTDESVLWGLPEGWRSPRFVMPANHGGPSAQRYSCYLRMRDAGDAPWAFGLIRLETYDPEQLDKLCATALAYRQPARTHDARGDRHLAPVALVEKWLRSRRPAYL